MKTILYNTNSHQTEGPVRGGLYNDIFNSGLSIEPGWLPDYMIQLELIEDKPPAIDTFYHILSFTWEADLQNKQYKKVWTSREKTPHELWLDQWTHPQFSMRMIVPKSLLSEYPHIAMQLLIRQLPIQENVFTQEYIVYMNTIMPEHESLVDELGNTLVVEFFNDCPHDEV